MTLETLPALILPEIYSLLDIPSVCRLYIAFAKLPIANDIANYLHTCKIKVSAETLISGDEEKIDFATLAKLPPCDLEVDASPGLMPMTTWHLKNIPYRLLSLSVDAYVQDAGTVQFDGIGKNLNELSLKRMRLDPKSIPTSVTKLTIDNCTITLPQSFDHLMNLTHFNGNACNFNDSFELPQLITHLVIRQKYDDPDYESDLSYNPELPFRFDASGLKNLKHVCHRNMVDLPWSQLESITDAAAIPSQRLDQLKEIEFCYMEHSLKHAICPKLERVKYYDWEFSTVDVTERFTKAQLAQLVSLECGFCVRDMTLLPKVQILHMSVDETFTEWFEVPPHLTELGLHTSKSIEGVPSKIKVLKCWNPSAVLIQSVNLRHFYVQRLDKVTVNCPRLTKLELLTVKEVGEINAPILVNLQYFLCHPPFPFEKGFPRLSHVYLGHLDHDYVLNQHFKSMELDSLMSKRLSVTADVITLQSIFVESVIIKAKVVKSCSKLSDKVALGIDCQELRCTNIGHVPRMVEKLTVDWLTLSNFDDSFSVSWADAPLHRPRYPPVLEFAQCHHLKSVYIKSANFSEYEREGITIPSSVRQFRMGAFKMDKPLEFDFKGASQLQHLECSLNTEDVVLETFGLSKAPASCYIPPKLVSFRPKLLKRGRYQEVQFKKHKSC